MTRSHPAARNPVALAFIGLLLLAGAALFLNRAAVNGREVNTNMNRTDQGAYIKYGMRLKESNFDYIASRNRMPLYPSFLAVLLGEDQTREEIFERGKKWNTWLALGCLAIIGAIFFRWLPAHAAMNALFLTAFTVYLFKAPHVQAEILYYSLFFFLFVVLWRLFQRPGPGLAILAGVLAGLTHLTKASVAPGLFCFFVFFTLDTLWKARQRRLSPATAGRHLVMAALLGSCFLIVVWPYISTSKRIYGHYFYNVNSTFYFWCDSWEDAEARTKTAGDRDGWPELPPDQLPSLKNYLRDHGAGDVFRRLADGRKTVWKNMRTSYGYARFLQFLAYASLALAIWKRKLLWRLIRRRPMPVLGLAAFFTGYFLLIAWYSQIIQGNRFILGIFLPFVFAAFVFLSTFSRRLRLRWKSHSIPAFTVFNIVFSVGLAIRIAVICIKTIHTTYGGS